MTSPLTRHRALLAQVEAAFTRADTARAEAAPPGASAAAVASHVAAIHRLGEVLRRLPTPIPPRELRSDSFYEGILDRAAAAAARDIGSPLLRAAFQPTTADSDVAWIEAGVSPALARALTTPAPRAPGWLLARIRRDLRDARPASARIGWTWVAAAAAVVLVGLFAARQGTPHPAELVFQQVDRPISTMGHPSDLLRDLGR